MIHILFKFANFYDNIAVKRKLIKCGEYDTRVTRDKD